MKFRLKALFGALLLMGLLGACATKPETPAVESQAPAPASSSIQAEASGLEPAGELRFAKITFAIEFGSPEAVKSWAFSIAGQKGKVFSAEGTGSNLPDSLSWDGNDSKGALAAEGSYTATLDVDYGSAFSPGKASSKPFVLVTTPPSATFSPNPGLFSYSASGITTPLSISIAAKQGLAKVVAWNLDVYDTEFDLFKSFSGTGATGKFDWDGKGDLGTAFPPAANFSATLTVTDEFGGKGSSKGSFALSDKPSATPPTIAMRRFGFSPASTSVKNTIDFLLTIPQKADASSWKLEVNSPAKGLVRSYVGSAANIPEFVRWDGKDETGAYAPQGPYYSVLTVSYGEKYKDAVIKGPAFSLVVDPPAGSITVDPPAPVLAELGPKRPLHFTVQAKSPYAQIASWTLSVVDRNGSSVAIFQANWPNNKVEWDGKTVDGRGMQPGANYDVVAKVSDEYGNVGTLRGSIAVDPLKSADEPSAIAAASPGFAPKGDGSRPTMDLAITAGNRSAISAWKVEIVNVSDTAVKSYSGSDSKVPAALSWDGKKNDGNLAIDGKYVARLSIDYGLRFSRVVVESKPFVLDLTAPLVSINLSNTLLSPDGDGQNDTVAIGIDASSGLARIASWSLTILDPGSSPFISFKGSWPMTQVVWDGLGASGDLVESASDYVAIARVRDEFGNIGEARKTIDTDILVIKTATGYRIRVSSIVFKGFTADYTDVPADRAQRNLATLDLLAEKLAVFPDYRVALEGHAVMINWDDKAKGDAEQAEVLIPLSKARAEAIAAALIERGMAADRLETRGLGAVDPIVPDSDYSNRWKNRRVDFILLK